MLIIVARVFPWEYWSGLANAIASCYVTIYIWRQSVPVGFSRVDAGKEWFFKDAALKNSTKIHRKHCTKMKFTVSDLI